MSSAPGILQITMEKLLQGIPHVIVYINDILFTGLSEFEHLRSLEEVLRRLKRAGLRAKKSKGQLLVPSVTYLRYVIDAQGLHPFPEKMEAIQQAPTPTKLKSYLGLLVSAMSSCPDLQVAGKGCPVD